MALVICWVLRMELIRLRIALRVAITRYRSQPSLGPERLFERFQDLVHFTAQIAVQFALLKNVGE